jgi:hypothetical protein
MLDPGPAPYDLDAYGDPVWVVVLVYLLIWGAPIAALLLNIFHK